jgi:hypothetical protein
LNLILGVLQESKLEKTTKKEAAFESSLLFCCPMSLIQLPLFF